MIRVALRQLAIPGLITLLLLSSCKEEPVDKRIKQIDPKRAAEIAAIGDTAVKYQLADSNLTLKLWGIDSLVISPIAIDIDDFGNLYYTTTNRQKNSEFDIRGHQDWEIPSQALQTIEDKRAFLRSILSPENSAKNTWLADLNGDSSHDWRDLTVEKEHVYRLKDTDGDGVADQSQLVVEDFHDEVTDVAGGVLATGDDLFVAVGPDLWRMKDKNGDGIADDKVSISHGYGIHIGFSGHGMSGVEMGPDGRIYWQIGDIGFNGVDQTGKRWEYPNCGVIARSNPDGSDFEIFAYGLRNTHEFAFDEYGNLVSEDNDGDHAGERERLVYIVNGSDAGWRSNWQYGKYRDPENNTYKVWMDEKMWMPRHDSQAAYIIPPIANYVSGPAGFVYNPGTALSPEYKSHFFVAKFVGNPEQSGVYAFTLKPKGAGFELGEDKLLVSGILPTGLDFGPDGAMYIADWIDGWGTHDYGRIWKLDDKRGANWEARKQTRTLLAADFSKKTKEELGTHLFNADMQVRLKAQFELAKRGADGEETFKKMLAQADNQLARIHAIWGLAQMARKNKNYAENILPYLKDKDPEIRAQAAKWIGDIKYKDNDAGNKLIPLLKDSYSRARFFAAEALGRIEHELAITPIIEMLRANKDEDVYLRHAGSLALARIGHADPIVNLAKDRSRAVRVAAVVALRRMGDPRISEFLLDIDEYIVTEAARAINDDLSIEAALPALGNLLRLTNSENEALVRRSINANLRVGTDEALQNLINYAQKEDAPAAMRAEAIDALSTWPKPSLMDRVDGRYRGPIERDPAKLRAAAGNALVQLLHGSEKQVRLSAIKAISKLKINEGADELMAILKNDKDPAIRAQALKSLATLDYPQMGVAIQTAIADKDKSVRVAGIDLVAKMNIPVELMVSVLTDVINNKTTEEKQSALLTLGKLPVQYTQKTLDDLVQKMNAKKLPPEIYLELAEAIDSSGSRELADKYKRVSATLGADTLTAAYADALYGGDAGRGRRIFFANQSAQCIRCHAIDDRGGNAGPPLDGVARRLSRQQLLEALINPSARIAPGYGTGGVSSMPDMRYVLSKREIRHVVAFLSELKNEK
jgi:quinoprotein glucose dehydrogenase